VKTEMNIVAPTISVVVPVYCCVDCLQQLCSELEINLRKLTPRYEIILVDDRSPDNAWPKIVSLQALFPSVKGIRLSRNFGQHVAITSGLAAAKGDYAIVMDCDLQDSPSLIPDLFAKIQEGYDLVLAKRVKRNHTGFRVWAAKFYFKVLSKLTEKDIDGNYGTLSILSRKVIDSFLQFNERERHYLFILRWLGFNAGIFEYEHQKREVGKSSYSLKQLLQHAVNGLLFQATALLKWIVALGLIFAFCGVSLAMFFIYQYFHVGSVAGWTSVAVLILICTGVILSSLGVIGLYIGKIFDQSKSRPLYVVDSVFENSNTW